MYFNELVTAFDKARQERNVFHDLMRYRVREVLLVGSLYDSFVVESDGVLSEQIYGEYFKLNLNTIPRVTCAYTDDSALGLLREGRFDLVILMAGIDFEKPISLARSMKAVAPGIPILLMVTNNSGLESFDPHGAELSVVDRVFVWNGYSKLFVAMIKYIEDLHNVDADTQTGQVRVILLIEDSVRYYSRYLPLLYQVVMRQTQALVEDEKGFETFKLLRSRARPKILIASSYEEAEALFNRHESYILTVLTDLRIPRRGIIDPEAGFEFLQMAKERIRDLPVMVQSSETGVRERAYAMGASFLDKGSESLEHDLESYLRESLGFGAFRFRDAEGRLQAEARTMDEFIATFAQVPVETVLFHASRNHFSAWFMARGEIRFARLLKPYRVDNFPSARHLRDFLLSVFENARRDKSRGLVPYFDEAICKDENAMTRLGDGSVGGKGRGIVFIRSLLENLDFSRYVQGISIKIPRTAFIGIDEFELFLELNGLWSFAYYKSDADAVRERFLGASFGPDITDRLRRFIAATLTPLAVRSSGLFEDMLMVPFSGIYDTYIIPNSHPDPEIRLRQLCDAIRLIYASLFSHQARLYFEATRYNLEEERMAVVVQELVGSRRGRWFYPHVSGTAQSYNYYPVAHAKPEDGLCIAALGLGSYVVDGGTSFHFCPRWPKLNLAHPERARADAQRVFWALDMERDEPDLSNGENAALAELDLSEAEVDPSFALLASTWDRENERFVPGIPFPGPRILDLAQILKYDALPFARAVDMVLDVGARSLGTPVEIEYALNLDEDSGQPALYLLQIKPLMRTDAKVDVDLDGIPIEDCLIRSGRSMGNGREVSIRDIVWLEPERFDRSRTRAIADEIESLDRRLGDLGRCYVLIGFGRWGTRDPWLGVPVVFSQIAHARVIVEAEMPHFHIESSLGSHFFHNVMSMNIGYMTIPLSPGTSSIDWAWLARRPQEAKTEHCVWTVLDEPMEILMDGKNSRSIILKGLRTTRREVSVEKETPFDE